MNAERERQERDEATLAEYALGVLPHDERQAFAERLAADPELREKLALWEAEFAPLADEFEETQAPEGAYDEIERRLFGTVPAGRTGFFSRLGFWRSLAVASLAGLIVLAGLYYNSSSVPENRYVAELSGENDVVRLVAFYDQREGILRLHRTKGSPVPGRSFQLWLIEPEQQPVSLGVLPKEDFAGVEISENLGRRLRDSVLAISDEPEGGSPTGQPTGDVLATGQITRI